MTADDLRRRAPLLLGSIRFLNGAAALLAPESVARRLGVDPEANPAPLYPLRMFGVRTVILGVELLGGGEPARVRAMRTGIAIHASDTVAAALGGTRGQLPPRVSALLTVVSSVNTLLAIIGSRPPRARRRLWR
jgi:hypothetical protein